MEENGHLPGDKATDPLTVHHEPSKQADVLESQTARMKRQIGLFGGISFIVGTIIGSGIFITPQNIIGKTNSVSLSIIVWMMCGFLAILSALSYCELGTLIPRSGGEHAYFMETFGSLDKYWGPLPAFLYAWLNALLLNPSGQAIASLAFGKYCLYPISSKMLGSTADFELAEKLIAVLIALLIAAVNIYSVKLTTRIAVVFLVGKLSAMAFIIGIGLYNVSIGHWGGLSFELDFFSADVGQVVASFFSGLWAYDGWNNLNFVIEELVHPQRNLPLAIIIGLGLVICLYVSINLSYLTVLSKEEMIASSAVAFDVGDRYLGNMAWVMSFMVSLSVAGSAMTSAFTAARLNFVAGREGHLPDVLSYIHTFNLTPVIAVLLNTFLGIAMIFMSDLNELIDVFGFSAWALRGLATACVVILRFQRPDAQRNFRVHLAIPILATVLSAIVVVVPIVTDPNVKYAYCVGFTAVGIIVYHFFVYKSIKVPGMDTCTRFIQLTFHAVPSLYKEE